MNNKKLRRSTKDCMIAGVCGGLGEFFGLDASLLRIIYILLAGFPGFPGLLIYIIMVFVVPKDNVE